MANCLGFMSGRFASSGEVVNFAVHSFRSFPLNYPRVCCVLAVSCPLFQKFPILLSQSLLCASCLLSTLLEFSHFFIPESAVYELSAVHSFRNVHFFIPESAVYKLSAVQSIQSFPLYYPRVCCVRAVCCPLFQKFPTLLSQSLLCTRNVSIHCADKQAVPE